MCRFIPDYLIKNVLLNANKLKLGTAKAFWDMSICPVQTNMFSFRSPYSLNDNGKVARTVYDAEEKTSLPGKVVREEGSNPVGDDDIDNAYDYSRNTLDFYKEFFNRNSIDNKGFYIHATVNYGKKYSNAFWNHKQIVFGKGDQEIFKSFMLLDIMGHEISHGLTSHSANLEYYSEPGSINEHFSDVFGMAIKQYFLGEDNKTSKWIVGEGIFCEGIQGSGIRSFKSPGSAYSDPRIGSDRQPAHYKDKYTGEEDGRGCHINSGILNKLFYEYCINTGDNSFGDPAKIWYEVLTTKLSGKSNFHDFVNATQEVIIQNYGTGLKYKAFREAGKCVGLIPRHPIFNQMFI